MVNFLSTLERIKENDHELTEVNFNLYKIKDAGAQDLANAFSNNNTLTSLSLGGNKITDAGAQALAASLVNNKTLTNLNISHNEIGALGTQALADSLVKNKALKNLNIRYNEIGDGGAQALAEALINNITLKSLNLSGNQITDVGAQDLEYALKDNIILSELRLDDNIRSNNLASIKNLIIRNKELPGKIVEKIYQSFVQNEQAHIAPSEPPLLTKIMNFFFNGQDHIAPPKPVLLDPIEKKLIAISPNACVEILKELLKKDGISKEDPEAIINHIKKFDGKGASGSRILISSLESKELESFFNLKERLSLADAPAPFTNTF